MVRIKRSWSKYLTLGVVLIVVVVVYALLTNSNGGGWLPTCGDGKCDIYEDYTNCPLDCGDEANVCGNGICEMYETPNNCLYDCGFNMNPPCETDNQCARTYFDPDPVCFNGTCIHPDRLP